MSAARSHQLPCGPGLRVSLTHYAGASVQPPHRHEFSQLSFLLAGSLGETLEGRDYALAGPAVGYKPAGALHGDRWGRDGALIFSIIVGDEAGETERRCGEPGWRSAGRGARVAEIVRACFDPDEALRSEAVQDALALAAPAGVAWAAAPSWLNRAMEILTEQPELGVDEVAKAVGVDRSHLARSFQRHFGIPPSVYRRRVLTARALDAIAGGSAPMGRIAYDAGFSDQAHMTRTMRSDIGLGPSRVRALLRREVTSVQDHFGSRG